MPVTPSTAIRRGFPFIRGRSHPLAMDTKSCEAIYGASVRAAAFSVALQLPINRKPFEHEVDVLTIASSLPRFEAGALSKDVR